MSQNSLRGLLTIVIFLVSCVKMKNKTITVATLPGETKTVVLPDSSVVILNAATSISYKEIFNREVGIDIDGEAYFKIRADRQKPFTVTYDSVMLKTTDAEFNFCNYDTRGPHLYQSVDIGATEARIAVYKGDLTVWYTPSRFYLLHNGEFAFAKKKFIRPQYWSYGENDATWIHGYYVFDWMQTDEFCKLIERVFSVRVSSKVNGSSTIEKVYLEKNKPLKDQLSKLASRSRFTFSYPTESTVEIDYCR